MKNPLSINSVSQKIRELWGLEVLPKMHGGLWENSLGRFYDWSIWKSGRGAYLHPTGARTHISRDIRDFRFFYIGLYGNLVTLSISGYILCISRVDLRLFLPRGTSGRC